ncbi:MAG: M15 family metallopeptidase [Symbiobacteriaceae bacterium]|nr:M15 family metallopeptidase [Symbiobacteriaceae bacterium]
MQEDTARAPSSPAEIADSAVKSTPDSENWNIHLVNLHHPLPDDYLPDLAPVPVVFAIDQATTYYLDFRVIDALQEMLSSSAEASLPIYVTSAFRTRSYQQTLYENEVQYYRNQGYSEEEAIVLGGSYVAYPGTSEHQLGLAVDLVSPDHYWLDESFEQTMAFAWLTEHAMEYGFVLRYPKDKTELTGIAYEPWHYRYVGPNHALSMKELSLCLEEYLETLDLP